MQPTKNVITGFHSNVEQLNSLLNWLFLSKTDWLMRYCYCFITDSFLLKMMATFLRLFSKNFGKFVKESLTFQQGKKTIKLVNFSIAILFENVKFSSQKMLKTFYKNIWMTLHFNLPTFAYAFIACVTYSKPGLFVLCYCGFLIFTLFSF